MKKTRKTGEGAEEGKPRGRRLRGGGRREEEERAEGGGGRGAGQKTEPEGAARETEKEAWEQRVKAPDIGQPGQPRTAGRLSEQ